MSTEKKTMNKISPTNTALRGAATDPHAPSAPPSRGRPFQSHAEAKDHGQTKADLRAHVADARDQPKADVAASSKQAASVASQSMDVQPNVRKGRNKVGEGKTSAPKSTPRRGVRHTLKVLFAAVKDEREANPGFKWTFTHDYVKNAADYNKAILPVLVKAFKHGPTSLKYLVRWVRAVAQGWDLPNFGAFTRKPPSLPIGSTATRPWSEVLEIIGVEIDADGNESLKPDPEADKKPKKGMKRPLAAVLHAAPNKKHKGEAVDERVQAAKAAAQAARNRALAAEQEAQAAELDAKIEEGEMHVRQLRKERDQIKKGDSH